MNESLKIAFYIGRFGVGGAERAIIEIASLMLERGHEVLLIANIPISDEYQIPEAISKIYLSKDVEKGHIKKNIRRVRKIRNICRNHKIDVLVSFLWGQNIRSLLALLGVKTKNVISVRNDPKRDMLGMKWLAAKTFFRIADLAVFQTEDARRYFPELTTRSAVIANPVNKKYFNVVANLDSKRIVSIGRLTKQKRQDLLIRAFVKSTASNQYSLHFYGEGEERDSLLHLTTSLGADAKVTFHGRSSKIEKVLSDAAMFVLCSDYEGMSNALLEAQAAGVPVIATDCPCGGSREVLKNGSLGELVPVNDEEALAKALDRLATSRELRENYSRKSREEAARFGGERIAEIWEEALFQLFN